MKYVIVLFLCGSAVLAWAADEEEWSYEYRWTLSWFYDRGPGKLGVNFTDRAFASESECIEAGKKDLPKVCMRPREATWFACSPIMTSRKSGLPHYMYLEKGEANGCP